MLKSVDVLIGLSVVMLVVSMAVTLLNQVILNLLASRGKTLHEGISDMLELLGVDFTRKDAENLAAAILTHPLIRTKSFTWLPKAYHFGDVIHREELVKILLDMPSGTRLEATLRAKLEQLMKANGIEDPAATLKKVRAKVLELEQSQPELANDIRQTQALLQEASSELLAKINLNFDHLIDRISVRFTASTRVVTFFSAVLVACALQLDTVYLLNRLDMDDAMRATLVQKAEQIYDGQQVQAIIAPQPAVKADGEKSSQANPKADPNVLAASTTAQSPAGETDRAALTEKTQKVKIYLNFMSGQGLLSVASTWEEWMSNWKYLSLPGLLLSIFLLNLGAPFWYSVLGKLLQLRSMLAQKDDAQKAIRQTSQAPAATPPQQQDAKAQPDPAQAR